MNYGKSRIQLSSENILSGLFAWVAFQSIIANYSIYYSYGLWMLSFVLMIAYMFLGKKYIFSNDRKSAWIYLMAVGIPYLLSIVINGCIPDKTYFFYLLYGILFLLVNKHLQYRIVYMFAWCLSLFLIPSLIEYLIYLFSHTGFVIGYTTREMTQGDTYYTHLILNLIANSFIFPRFQSIANEPGLIGTLCGFLLFFVGKNKKMRLPFAVFLTSGFFSFSFAFYIIVTFYFLSGVFNVKKIAIFAISIIILISTANTFFDSWIVQRVASMDFEELDNRTTATFDFRFKQAWERGQLWYGLGANNLPIDISYGETTRNQGGNAGAKKWIMEYGIIGFVCLFLGHCLIYFRVRSTKVIYYDIAFLLIFWLSFYQRQTIYTCYTFLAYCAVPLEMFKQSYEKKETNKTNYSISL